MAISKILCMKDCGRHFHGKHLKRTIDYILNPEKTQGGRLVGGLNCQPDFAFEQMRETKRSFGKVDKRQGYHLILSFQEGEATPDLAFEITQRFAKEYLGEKYETVFCVHDNTDHIHSHVVFNSVSFLDGKKYRYEKGDWAKEIQPITNRLCAAYGLSTIEIGDESHENQNLYKEWNDYRDGRFEWTGMIRRDLDACILQASDFEHFVELLREKGYEIKPGKHLAIKPQGMTRFRRCKTIGEDYTEERIRERILTEDMTFYQRQQKFIVPKIVKCHVKRYRRTKLSGLQKKYYAKLYRLGKLKKKPYSQAWKYRNEIRKMHQLQQEYLFLIRHDIQTTADLQDVVGNLTDKKKESTSEKSRIYKAKQKFHTIYEIADSMKELEPAELSYKAGDTFFSQEHDRWEALRMKLFRAGYTLEEVEKIRTYHKEEIKRAAEKEKTVARELGIGKAILKDILSGEEQNFYEDILKQKKGQDKATEKEETRETGKQPVR